jgi:hypothetical protein
MKIPLTIYDLRFTPRIRHLGKDGASRLIKGGRGTTRACSVPPSFPLVASENMSEANDRIHRPTASPSPRGEGWGEGEKSCRFNTPMLQPLSSRRLRHSRKSERGIALVITLILLSVTLVMAVAFLAISRRERNSVSTETDTTTAKLAADSALAQAESQLVSGMLATTNPYVFSLLVSTNYINAAGFTNAPLSEAANPDNVNYNNYPNNTPPGPLSLADMQQNIANLQYLPRAPVYASNSVFAKNELQFYLDLNRNGRYDTNGWVTNIDNEIPAQGFGTNWEVGDPEWIGILEHPDAPHSANNPFIARYAFIAVPANSLDLNTIHNQALEGLLSGNPNVPSPSGRDAYSRDQGVGPWEINLAAFLTDLDTNRWDPVVDPYNYPIPIDNSSAAFDDARALVAWRYADFYSSLASANAIFGIGNGAFFATNGIDEYGVGSQSTFDMNFIAPPTITANSPWLGAQNPNNFFSSPSDLFNPAKSFNPSTLSSQFTNNLTLAGAGNSTYDRYTFYRMLGQLGTDTSPESDKINLNYQNAVVTYTNTSIPGIILPINVAVVPGVETNLVPWAPLDFFTAAADKLLHAYSAEWYQINPSNYIQSYYGFYEPFYTNIDGLYVTNISHGSQVNQIPDFGITNIPVYINGQFVYSSAINRLLQLAANIYDASTNIATSTPGSVNYPSVFRPIFWVTNEFELNLGRFSQNVYIRGFQCLQSPFNTVLTLPATSPPAFAVPVEVNTLPLGIDASNVWGVPWIIGAKKGLPNFNAFEMVNGFFIERELQYNRNPITSSGETFPYGRVYTTNQMFIMGISNYLGVEDWNSYASNYNNQVEIVAQNYLSDLMTVTNSSVGEVIPPFNNYPVPLLMQGTPTLTTWSGNPKQIGASASFVLPLVTNMFWLTNSEYYNGPGSQTFGGSTFTAPCLIPNYLDPSNFLDAGTGTGPMPQFNIIITNRLQAYILDTDPRHAGAGNYILDYVQLGGMNNNLNINQAIADPDNQGLWSTNFYNGGANTPYGVNKQYLVSSGGGSVPGIDNDLGGGWTGSTGNSGLTSIAAQQAFFSAFFSPNNTAYDQQDGGILVSNYDTTIQAPYTPIRRVVQKFVFEANDPLVHYLSSDLLNPSGSTNGQRVLSNPPLSNLGVLSGRYMPWGNTINQLPATYNYVNGATPTDYQNPFNLSYKDPLVNASDNWDFPTNKYPTVGWLGRVHRGTPWQSVYMKSSNLLARTAFNNPNEFIGAATWEAWTTDPNAYDANNSAPVQDRLLFDLFTAAPDSQATRGRLNVNIGADDPLNSQAGLASWSALLSGGIAFSNSQRDTVISTLTDFQNPLPGETGPVYLLWTNQPAGLDIANSTLGQIVQSINSARTNYVGIDGLHGVFEHAGDVLAASKLSDGSPFLNADANQQIHAISDEMYEWLPQQIMSLVDVSGTPQSPPRYVVYCYGQTLKPAPDGIVSSGQFFGLCTNYQVTAESASRAIIRIENTPTPANPNATPHIVVEQYNPLPPD